MRKYQPSNGTEGMFFAAKFCEKCKHEQFMHSKDHNDKMCPIFTASILYNVKEDKYPSELTYDSNDMPTCTKHEPYEWKKDSEGKWIEPEFKDPNQLDLFV